MTIPEKIKTLMKTLINEGHEAYIIGGAVRDTLMGNVPKDWDIFTNATGKKILMIFPQGHIIGGEERQTKILTVVVDGVEISQYRKNGDRTKTGFSLEEHQDTCDFTINSIAMNIEGKIFDRHHGQDDIKVKSLCFVGVPLDRIMEDPLRILRGIRFWTKYRMMFEDIIIVLNHISLLDSIPKERIREEFIKILQYHNGIENLWCDGIIYKILPELKTVVGMHGGDRHCENVDQHIMNAFKEACKITDNINLRLACFLHDIGKGLTMEPKEDGGVRFHGHDNKGEELMKNRLAILKFNKDDIKYITTLIKCHMYSYKVDPSKKSYIKFFNKLEEAKIPIEDYIMLIYCDHQGNMRKPRIKLGDFIKGNWLHKKYYEIKYSDEPMSVKDLKISGKDIMEHLKLEPGPEVGKLLNIFFERVMEGEIKNNRADLLNKLKTIVVDGGGK